MAAKDEWVLFLEKNPQFNELSKSKLYISLLKSIKKESLNIDKIHLSHHNIENRDLDLILQSLIKLELVYRIKTGKQVLFGITPKGRELLKTYETAREGFKIE